MKGLIHPKFFDKTIEIAIGDILLIAFFILLYILMNKLEKWYDRKMEK